MFRPPVDRTMQVLNRSFFSKTVIVSAARIFDSKNIHPFKQRLAQEALEMARIPSVVASPLNSDQPLNRKALLLRPEIKAEQPETWTSTLKQLAAEKMLAIVPYELKLDYDYWNYDDIMGAILPEAEQDEIPAGFSLIGHVAHLNLRHQYLPYKHLIAEVLADKNPVVKTVINKVQDVGADDPFRTFKFEVLYGPPDLQVEVRESNCIFRFDYSKVYWNPRLGTEHERLIEIFQAGEAVCDVMAGVGPFAVPAAKKRVFVWANDLNPAGYQGLVDARKTNHTEDFLKPFNKDGRDFIRQSAQQLLELDEKVEIKPKVRKGIKGPLPESQFFVQPKTFQHYVMNLPATATEFLDAFIGLYEGQSMIFAPELGRKLPMVHVYCFSTKTKSDDDTEPQKEICAELSRRLGHAMGLGKNELAIHNVRDVAPNKRMFCASFRLPEEVAFRRRSADD